MVIFERGFVKKDPEFSHAYLSKYFEYTDQKAVTSDFLCTYQKLMNQEKWAKSLENIQGGYSKSTQQKVVGDHQFQA